MHRIGVHILLALTMICCVNVSGMVICFDRSGDVSLDVACGGERCCAPEQCCGEATASDLSDSHDCCVDVPLPSFDDAKPILPASSKNVVDSKLTQVSGVLFPGSMSVSATEFRCTSPPIAARPLSGRSEAPIPLRI